MRITVLAVGKLKERFFKEAVEEYEKRLSRYCRFEIIEVEDERTPDKAGAALEEQIKGKEADRILKHVKEDARVITLEILGRKLDSPAFARMINQCGLEGISHIQFIIGGSLGLHNKVSQRADDRISFSELTFPHQLMRVILSEQIYRSFRILHREPYHK